MSKNNSSKGELIYKDVCLSLEKAISNADNAFSKIKDSKDIYFNGIDLRHARLIKNIQYKPVGTFEFTVAISKYFVYIYAIEDEKKEK
ncbi:hypothetical protein M2S00_06820 [Apilactobacillus sp. TMW 2.2459]|uniref:hypothetical protein n=1 Tax=Apilactobacillus xinyiensis TaxID=2841032 RepID=UPI00200F8496|nr:hypothetical protein [Apilactobacillus xinyiensis]MCL0312817.1 hypothetical protein [Apilactobacillus xinyiensis]